MQAASCPPRRAPRRTASGPLRALQRPRHSARRAPWSWSPFATVPRGEGGLSSHGRLFCVRECWLHHTCSATRRSTLLVNRSRPSSSTPDGERPLAPRSSEGGAFRHLRRYAHHSRHASGPSRETHRLPSSLTIQTSYMSRRTHCPREAGKPGPWGAHSGVRSHDGPPAMHNKELLPATFLPIGQPARRDAPSAR